MTKPSSLSAWRPVRNSVTLIVVIATLFIILLTWRYNHVRQDTEDAVAQQTLDRAAGLAAMASDMISTGLEQVDQAQKMAVQITEAHLAGNREEEVRLRAQLDAALRFAVPDLVQVAAISADGFVLWSNLPYDGPLIDLRDREHYQALANHPDRDSFVGRPVIGRISGGETVQFVRALRRPNRTLRAITLVAVNAGALQRLTAAVPMIQGDAISLLRDDGMVLMRSDGRYLGEKVDPIPKEELYSPSQSITDRTRFAANRIIPGTSLVVTAVVKVSPREPGITFVQGAMWRGVAALDGFFLLVCIGAVSAIIVMRRTTQQRANAMALARSEQWFRGLVEGLADGVLIFESFSEGRRILYLNEAMQRMIGATANEVIGQVSDQFVHPDDLDFVKGRAAALWAGQSVSSATYRLVSRSGKLIWVMAQSQIISFGDQKQGPRLMATLRDITEQQQQQLLLQQTKSELEHLLTYGPGALFQLVRDPDGTWHHVSKTPNANRILGLPESMTTTIGSVSRIVGRDLFAVRMTALDAAGPAETATIEYNLHWQGRSTRIRENLARTVLPDGRVEIIVYVTDVTAGHEIAQARRRAENDLAMMVALGPGVLYRAWISNDTLIIQRVQGDLARVIGLRLAGQPPEDALATLLNGNEFAERLRVLATNPMSESTTVDVSVEHEGGHRRWLRVEARRVTSGDDAPDDAVELIGYLSDVTREKEETRRAMEVSRLATLGEMATGIAHELNTPLASISMAAENALITLEMDNDDLARVADKLRKIAAEALRAGNLVAHMQIFARNAPTATAPISLFSALSHALEILRPRLRDVRVRNNLPPNLPMVVGHAIPVEQVFINLISNACDAYETAEPPVADGDRIVTVTGSVESGMIVVRVADHAGGVPDHLIDRLFEPFFTTKPSGKGTGLGLPFCLRTVTEMKGTIRVRSEDGGAVFEIRLPPAAKPAARRPAGSSAVPA